MNDFRQRFYGLSFTNEATETCERQAMRESKVVQVALSVVTWFVVGSNLKTILLIHLESRNPGVAEK